MFLFGLLHGLGFAGVLRELGLPRGEFLTALLSFNLGVEFGQVSVIAAAALVTAPFVKGELLPAPRGGTRIAGDRGGRDLLDRHARDGEIRRALRAVGTDRRRLRRRRRRASGA